MKRACFMMLWKPFRIVLIYKIQHRALKVTGLKAVIIPKKSKFVRKVK